MNEEAKKKYLEIKKLFKRMSDDMCLVVESYYIWRTLKFSQSTVESGEHEAERNVKVINLYKEFFLPTEQSHLRLFVIGICKFFDRQEAALSLKNLIEVIKSNKNLFTPEVAREVHPALAHTDAFKDDYVPITDEIISEIEGLRKPHEVLLGHLKDVRDKQFAHTDMTAFMGNFVPNEVEKLIESIQKMFNKLSGVFESSTTMWHHLGEDCERSTKFLLENLERGEEQRQKEIQERYRY